jgi:hypothetical protein
MLCDVRVIWRAWLGMGDENRMNELGVAEFGTAEAARAWVERGLVAAGAKPGMKLFGSVDRGSYVMCDGEPARWELDPHAGTDAALVDGRVAWQRPG